MREEVRLQIAPLIEATSADHTLVRRLLHMQDLVHRQRSALAEALAALGALERLLLAVYVAKIKRQIRISHLSRAVPLKFLCQFNTILIYIE